jgi:hypothetical protein
MNAIAKELDDRLRSLDPQTAAHVEKLVREALALVDHHAAGGNHGWPPGYFEETAGAFAGEPLERPPQGEAQARERW